jgi:hypothetical protein
VSSNLTPSALVKALAEQVVAREIDDRRVIRSEKPLRADHRPALKILR